MAAIPKITDKLSFKISAYSADISCDFESERWDTGFCNWIYDFSSKDIFQRTLAPLTDNALKQRWKFGEKNI